MTETKERNHPIREARKIVTLALVLGGLLFLPTLMLGRMPLAGIAGLLLLVTGGLLAFAKEPKDHNTGLIP